MKYLKSKKVAFFAAGGSAAALLLAGAAHAITDNVFKYSTPRTGWYGLSPMGFVPDRFNSADGYAQAEPLYLSLANGHTGGCFDTGVNLPHNAKITGFAVWYRSDTSPSVTAAVYRSKISDGTANQVAFLSSTDTSLTRKGMAVAVPDSATATVNNRDYVYSVLLCFNHANDRYYAGRITYSYATAGD